MCAPLTFVMLQLCSLASPPRSRRRPRRRRCRAFRRRPSRAPPGALAPRQQATRRAKAKAKRPKKPSKKTKEETLAAAAEERRRDKAKLARSRSTTSAASRRWTIDESWEATANSAPSRASSSSSSARATTARPSRASRIRLSARRGTISSSPFRLRQPHRTGLDLGHRGLSLRRCAARFPRPPSPARAFEIHCSHAPGASSVAAPASQECKRDTYRSARVASYVYLRGAAAGGRGGSCSAFVELERASFDSTKERGKHEEYQKIRSVNGRVEPN